MAKINRQDEFGVPMEFRDLGTFIEPKKKNSIRLLKRSSYIITINSNKKPGLNVTYRNILSDALRDASNDFSIGGIRNCIIFKNEGESWGNDKIKRVYYSHAVEVDDTPRGGRVHLHAMLDIYHTTKIKLDYAYIRDYIYNILVTENRFNTNLTNVYTSIQWVKKGLADFYHLKYADEEYLNNYFRQDAV